MASERTPLCMHGRLTPSNPSLNRDSKEPAQSAVFSMPSISETALTDQSSAGTSGAMVHVVDLEELLHTLERASGIIKSHLRQSDQVVIAPPRQRRPLIPNWVINGLFFITLMWQGLNVGLLEGLHALKTEGTYAQSVDSASTAVMTVFQALNLLLVLYVTFKLARQVIGRTASGYHIAQSYLSTVLLFAGLYTLEFNIGHHAWYLGNHGRRLRPVLLYVHMLYFSVSTATLCGTSQIEPARFYTDLTVSFQMLTSFVYFASILSLAVIPRKNSHTAPSGRSFTHKIKRALRWCLFRGNG